MGAQRGPPENGAKRRGSQHRPCHSAKSWGWGCWGPTGAVQVALGRGSALSPAGPGTVLCLLWWLEWLRLALCLVGSWAVPTQTLLPGREELGHEARAGEWGAFLGPCLRPRPYQPSPGGGVTLLPPGAASRDPCLSCWLPSPTLARAGSMVKDQMSQSGQGLRDGQSQQDQPNQITLAEPLGT